MFYKIADINNFFLPGQSSIVPNFEEENVGSSHQEDQSESQWGEKEVDLQAFLARRFDNILAQVAGILQKKLVHDSKVNQSPALEVWNMRIFIGLEGEV